MNRQKGFGSLEIILIAGVILLIGAVVWLFIQNNNNNAAKSNTDLVKSVKSTEPKSDKESVKNQDTPQNPELSWFSYSPKAGQYSIKVPDGWTLHTKSGDDTSLYSNGDLTLKQGTPGRVVNTVGNIGACGYFILDFLPYTKQETWPEVFKTESGLSVRKTSGKDELGVSGGGMGYSYNVTKNQKTIYISYSTCKGDTIDHHELVERTVKTLSIN